VFAIFQRKFVETKQFTSLFTNFQAWPVIHYFPTKIQQNNQSVFPIFHKTLC